MNRQNRILSFTLLFFIATFSLLRQLHGKDVDLLQSHRNAFKKLPQSEELVFRDSSYGACFTCHDPSMAYDENAGDARTRFKDFLIGKNLHHLHLLRQPKGTNCTGCHAVGESEVTLTVEVALTRERNGGSCQPSCHRPKKYLNGP